MLRVRISESDRAAGDRSAVSSASRLRRRHPQWLGRYACRIWSVGPTNTGAAISAAASATVALRLAPEVAARRLYGRRGLHPRGRVLESNELDEAQTARGERHGEGPAARQSRSQEAEEGKSQGDRGVAEPQGRCLAAGFRAAKKVVARRRRGWGDWPRQAATASRRQAAASASPPARRG